MLTESIDITSSGMWNMEDFEYKTHHYMRCREMCFRDPVHTIILKDYLQSQLIMLKTQQGDERYQSLMISVDKAILTNLAEFVNVGITIPTAP